MTIQSSVVQRGVSSTVHTVHIGPSPDAARQKTYRERLGTSWTAGQLTWTSFSRVLTPNWLAGRKPVAGQLWLGAVIQRTGRAEGLVSPSTQSVRGFTARCSGSEPELPRSPATSPLSAIHMLAKKYRQRNKCLSKLTTRDSKPSTHR